MEDSIRTYVAEMAILSRTLMRRKNRQSIREGIDVGRVLREILEWANRFLPSESGSILLDDPVMKLDNPDEGRLYFAACFGINSQNLAGTSIGIKQGIAGETYRSGRPYISRDVSRDRLFLRKIEETLGFKTRSIICTPIVINRAIVGVIELINRKQRDNFDDNDLLLLEIFSGYTAMLMESALAAREFEEMSKHDNLTGLYNDRYLLVRIEEEVYRAFSSVGDTSLIFFDLDRFKEINDAHGHLAGSRVLAEIGGIVREVFQGTGALSARYGGDEYAIIMPGKSLSEATVFAERLRVAIAGFNFLSAPGSKGEPPLSIKGIITASVGVASLRENVRPEMDQEAMAMAESLLRAADSAMYLAKNSGKNKLCSASGFY